MVCLFIGYSVWMVVCVCLSALWVRSRNIFDLYNVSYITCYLIRFYHHRNMKMLAKKIVFCQKQFFFLLHPVNCSPIAYKISFFVLMSNNRQTSAIERKSEKKDIWRIPMMESNLWETDEHLSEHDMNIEHVAYTKLKCWTNLTNIAISMSLKYWCQLECS